MGEDAKSPLVPTAPRCYWSFTAGLPSPLPIGHGPARRRRANFEARRDSSARRAQTEVAMGVGRWN